MKAQIARSVFWLVWSRGVVQVLSFASTVLVARLLNPADYGLMALTSVWVYSVALIAELGLGAAILQFRDLDDAELNACFWLILGLALIGYGALFAAAPGVGRWFADPRLADVLRVAGLGLPLLSARLVPDGLLRKGLDLHRVSQIEVVSMVATIPVVLGFAWAGAGVWALVAGALVMPFVQGVGTFWVTGWRPGLHTDTRRLGEILRYSLGAFGAKVGWVAFQQMDTFILGKTSGAMVTGLYSMGKTLAHLPSDKISIGVNQLASPVMAGLQGDMAAMRASLLRGLRLVGCVTAPLSLGVALVADDLVWLVLGAKWMPAVPIVRVLSVCALIRALDVLFPPVLFARYRTTFMSVWTAGLLLVMPVAFWAGASGLGAVGVALAWVVVYPLMVAWLASEALKEMSLPWRAVWNQLQPVAHGLLLMVPAVLLVRWASPGFETLDRLTRLLLSSAAGALTYGLAIYLRGGQLRGEIEEVASWIFRRPSVRPPPLATS